MKQEGKRPFTARSVLASALLGEDPPELPVAHLVHLAGLFGIGENRARVALSRMVSAGEATTDGSGRYRLAGHLLERRRRQEESRTGPSGPWAGRWWVVLVVGPARAAEDRAARRERLTRARLSERREGVWLRPDNLALPSDVTGDADLLLLHGEPVGDPRRLAADLWDLEGWAEGARELLAGLADHPTREVGDLAGGFELSASVLRHLVADPLLPQVLLPAGWPGPHLRRTYDEWDARYRDVLRAWGRAQEQASRPA